MSDMKFSSISVKFSKIGLTTHLQNTSFTHGRTVMEARNGQEKSLKNSQHQRNRYWNRQLVLFQYSFFLLVFNLIREKIFLGCDRKFSGRAFTSPGPSSVSTLEKNFFHIPKNYLDLKFQRPTNYPKGGKRSHPSVNTVSYKNRGGTPGRSKFGQKLFRTILYYTCIHGENLNIE